MISPVNRVALAGCEDAAPGMHDDRARYCRIGRNLASGAVPHPG